MKTINEYISYLKQMLYLNITLNDAALNYTKAIPLAIKSRYDIHNIKIENINALVLVAIEDIKSIKKHIELFNIATNLPIIIAFDKINSSDIKYLIENGISFVSYDSIYLPQLLIYLDNINQKKTSRKNKKLSKLAQTILISSIIEKKYNSKEYETDIESTSHIWGVTKMSSSRALKELEEFGYLTCEPLGRKKYYFLKGDIDIDKLINDLKNPVINSVYIKSQDLKYFNNKVLSSYSALAKYTNITNTKPIYAIEKSYFDNTIKKDNAISIYDDEYDNNHIEVELYRYNPILNMNHEIVDQISLYFSMKDKIDINDSRLNNAIEELKIQIKELCR